MKSEGNPDLSFRPYQPRQTKTTAADSSCNAIRIQLYLGHELVFLDAPPPIIVFTLFSFDKKSRDIDEQPPLSKVSWRERKKEENKNKASPDSMNEYRRLKAGK